MMLVARDRRTMGEHRVGRWLVASGWLVTAVVTAACAAYLWQTFVPGG
jgi:Mn2+/Fe2+ NRAMP family transporter